MQQKIIIAGPCAAESREQIIDTAQALKKRGIRIMRACWWKPRTKPGFEGMGVAAAAWMACVTKMGITIATEVLLPKHVMQVINGIAKNGGDPTKILLWIGSRNQNHVTQREIAKAILEETPNNVKLMIKNQPWLDEAHWLGIISHVLRSGISPDRVILCHRGFSPSGGKNPRNLRNIPDYEMAMKIKKETGLSMIIDPSHIGGSVDNALQIVKEADRYAFDGLIVEVHPNPKVAMTDAKQQLTFLQLDKLLKII